MGTRSIIGVMHGDKCKSIYCHWDGYLSNNGKILQEHYNSAKANHLVALGDVSSLRENVEIPEGVTHNYDNPQKDITIFYGRDRGEDGTEFKVTHSFGEFLELVDNSGAEFYYLMQDGEWFVGAMYDVPGLVQNGLVPLSAALAANV